MFLGVWIIGPVPFPAAAQDSEGGGDELPIDSEWPDKLPDLYSRGDKTIGISVGPLFSLLENIGPVGGTLSFSYSYFFNSHLFIGGELQGMFIPTKGENILFIVPMGARVGYQFVLRRFEIPLALTIGFAPEKYMEKDYGGFFMKPAASFFWRFNPNWSFGLNAEWWWVPQWPENGFNMDGHFIEVSLSARYHF
ncbi:hypothetical protein AGMMS4952_07890 [Spirochaetia bacterium]|nr:hypothetical protein AGMMS4952_07890 [Spirochaetia bacterium]